MQSLRVMPLTQKEKGFLRWYKIERRKEIFGYFVVFLSLSLLASSIACTANNASKYVLIQCLALSVISSLVLTFICNFVIWYLRDMKLDNYTLRCGKCRAKVSEDADGTCTCVCCNYTWSKDEVKKLLSECRK